MKLRTGSFPAQDCWIFSRHKLAIMRGQAAVLPGAGFRETRMQLSNTYSDVGFLSHLLTPHFFPFIQPLCTYDVSNLLWMAGSTDLDLRGYLQSVTVHATSWPAIKTAHFAGVIIAMLKG